MAHKKLCTVIPELRVGEEIKCLTPIDCHTLERIGFLIETYGRVRLAPPYSRVICFPSVSDGNGKVDLDRLEGHMKRRDRAIHGQSGGRTIRRVRRKRRR